MAERRKAPKFFALLAILFLVIPVGLVAWWLNRPAPIPENPYALNDFDVVCTGRVDVPGMLIALEPSAPGRVVEINPEVAEGKLVKANQTILRIDPAAALSRKAAAQAAVDLAEVSVEQAKLDEKRFPQQKIARGLMAKATEARIDAAKKILEQRVLQKNVTPISKAELEAMDFQIKEMELLKEAEEKQLADFGKLEPSLALAVTAAQARKAAAQADLDLAKQAEADCVIKAPTDGRILRMQATVGGVLMPGGYAPAVVFAPTSKGLIVRAEIDQEFLGRVKEGMKADVQDDNRPDAETYKGTVVRVARFVTQKRSMLLDPGEINDVRTIECIIEFDKPTDDMVIGQRMRVRIRGK